MKYVESIVITVYIPITGSEVIHCNIEVKKLLIHSLIKFKKLLLDASIIDITCSVTSILSNSIDDMYPCIWLYILSIWIFILCNKFEASVINITIPQTIKEISKVKIHSKTIIALDLLVNFVFLFTNFIIGSINNDITKPIKKGI